MTFIKLVYQITIKWYINSQVTLSPQEHLKQVLVFIGNLKNIDQEEI